jgi:hypothetical protein
MITLLRLSASLLATAVRLAPPRRRPHSNLGQISEHTLTFGLVGLAFAIAHPLHPPPAAAITILMAGMLELAQMLLPGRHTRRQDFVLDTLGL